MTTAVTDPTGLDFKVPSPEYFADYEVGSNFTPPPPAKFVNEKGKLQFQPYTLTLPGVEGFELGKTKDGWLKVIVKDIKVSFVDAKGNDREYLITQTHIGTNRYNQKDKAGNVTGQRNSSPIGDFFRAAGVDLAAIMPSTAQQYVELLHAVAGRQVQATIDWQSYDSETASTVAGTYDDYPLENETAGPNSARQPFVVIGGKNFWARAGVKRWISAI